jgi:hypothetical protein
MITLIRDGITMEVATELQASVFIRSGYKRVEAKKASVEEKLSNAVIGDEEPEQKPKRRTTRKPKA